ncbi:MAG: ABC transporter permease [Oceanicaulis sp.]
MRAIYLIARREYLSYVATWGFWLSLLAVPIFAVIGGTLPALIQNSQPVRYFAVIDETGGGLEDVVRARLDAERREEVRALLEGAARMMGGEAAAEEALAVFDRDPDGLSMLDEAIEAAGLQGAEAVLGGERRDMVMVDAPGASIDDLRPYLTGERMIDTPDGERALFAAFVIREDRAAPIAVDYYSTNLTSRSVRERVTDALTSHIREQAFIERGLQPEQLDQVMALRPDVTTLDARPGAEIGEEVTTADRAPFVVAVLFAFVLWLAVFSVANMLLTSLVEEKGGKIIELLLSTARFHEILIGKLAGVAAVSLTLFAIWGGVGGALTVFGGAALAQIDPQIMELLRTVFDPGLVLAALFFFTAGYLMYGAIFLAIGSLCDTLQDAQTLMGPVIWALMLPLLFLFFSIEASDSLFVRFASWFPLWTPFIMMARLPAEPPLWELAGASAIMIVTTLLVLWGAAAVFRQGALRQADADSVRKFFRLGGKKKPA